MIASLEAVVEKARAGKLDEARKALNAVSPSEENRRDVTFVKGFLRQLDHDREGALSAYEEVLREQPDHEQAAFQAALVCDLSGDDDAALHLLQRCTARDPVHVNALVNLALVYEERGRLYEAQALLHHVVDLRPDHFRAKQFLKSVDSTFDMAYDEQGLRDHDIHDAVLDTPISDFELSVRSRNCLRQMNIRTLGDLLRTSEAELLAYKNFGETSLNEIKALLTLRGLHLGQLLQPSEVEAEVGPEVAEETPAAARSHSADLSINMRRSVSELELSVRSRKALQRLGISSLGELAMRSEQELMSIKNFGQTSLNEIKQQLKLYGLGLRNNR